MHANQSRNQTVLANLLRNVLKANMDESGKNYMAVDQPSTRVVRNETDHQVAIRIQHSNVSARHIADVELGIRVKLSCTLRQDPKVVTVHVDGVVDCAGVVDHKVHPLVRFGIRRDLLRRIEGRLTIDNLLKCCKSGQYQ